jgi:hypothetical protein
MCTQFHFKYNPITIFFQSFQQVSNIVINCPKNFHKKIWIQVVTTTTSLSLYIYENNLLLYP